MAGHSLPGRAGAVLRHPAILLITGALISSYLIPSFTRGWQDHQKELELKSALVTDMTQSSTSMLLAVRFAHFGAAADTNSAYRAWQIQSAVIASRLRAYFPGAGLADEWTGYRDEVDVFNTAHQYEDTDTTVLWCAHASLLATSPAVRETERLELFVPLKSPIRVNCQRFGVLPVARHMKSSTRAGGWEGMWSAVEREMYLRRDELVKRVLDEHVNSF